MLLAPCSLLPAARTRAQRGFALLITITLLAFIVVLLLGLAAYTRIETAVAGNTQRQAQARENALMALQVAVGHLQAYAGPDQRVTATAEAFPNVMGTSRYTGVWHSDPAVGTSPDTPLTWLVSGNETFDSSGAPQPLAVTPAAPGTSVVELVGRNATGSTTRNANYIVAPLQEIRVRGLPSAPPTLDIPIGRYAWWVGDQGVKAPVALPDASEGITYPPYDSADLRTRIRQQVSLGAGAADTSGNPVFEPRDSNNASLVANEKITAFNQLPFLRWSNNNATTKLNTLRANFHTWSPNNFNVLANTKTGGLRQDLSLNPGLLGSAFEAWANYPAYMEPFATPPPPPEPGVESGSGDPPAVTNTILPAYGADPLRRRYAISPGGADRPRVAPVLTYFHLLFGVRKPAADSPYTLSVRWAVALWNPYSSALIPEDLLLEVAGLPTDVVFTDAATGFEEPPVSLSQLYGSPFKVTLPWAPTATDIPQHRSWLPGRVYNWTYQPEAVLDPSGDNPGRFNSRDLTEGFEKGLISTVLGSDSMTGSSLLALKLPSTTSLVLQLKRANGEVLGTYTSPPFDAVPISDADRADGFTSQVGFVFRLAESLDTAATPNVWLSTLGRDPRGAALPPESFIAVPNGTNPAAYKNWIQIRAPGRLLDRDITTGTSYNEDVPLFELPRRPLLSPGELQHVYLPGARPFSIGNPWSAGLQAGGVPLEQVFDRFFFSGIAANVTPGTNAAGTLVLPNPTLRATRNADGARVTVDDFRAAADARSSKYLLQGAAFNLNSTNAAAWAAVLRGVRFPAPAEFTYLDTDPESGTAPDNTTAAPSGNAHFFRFPQSAQEVYKAESDYVQSTPQDEVEVINTHLFRRGMRSLTAARLTALATKIAEFVRTKHAAGDGQGGPFRSLEEFLSPSPLFAIRAPPSEDPEAPPPPPGAPRSLLEAAIEDAGTNSSIGEFSSQWLTQADIMTALAPVLFARSDTFVIRAYGEAINSAKLNNNGSVPDTAIEGRAWCEAIVQRVPEYLDPSRPVPNPDNPEVPLTAGDAAEILPANLTSPLNQTFGRRFKIVSFRWLTRSDI